MAGQDEVAASLEVRSVASERLTMFVDAVIAIAITLLALDLPMPSGVITPFATRALYADGGFQVRFIFYAAVQVTR